MGIGKLLGRPDKRKAMQGTEQRRDLNCYEQFYEDFSYLKIKMYNVLHVYVLQALEQLVHVKRSFLFRQAISIRNTFE